MQSDAVERALTEVAASRNLRERQLARRLETQRQLAATTKPIYILKSKKQLELRLQ